MPVSIGSQATTYSITSADFYLLADGSAIFAAADGISVGTGGGGSNILVNGGIFTSGVGNEGIRVDDTAVDIVIGVTGQIAAEAAGVVFTNNADGSTLENFGSITSLDSVGMSISFGADGGATVNNHGMIAGKTEGVHLAAEDVLMANSGLITGAQAVVVDDTNATLVNTGDIIERLNTASSGTPTPQSAIGFSVFGDDFTLHNHGTIVGYQTAIDASGGSTTNLTVFNHGSITGDVLLSNGSLFVNAGGTVDGNMTGETGIDQVVNSGGINGDVALGSNTDTFRGFGGTVTGTIDGGEDSDTYFIDQSDAVIADSGTAGTDILYARSDVLNATGIEEIRLLGAGDHEVIGDGSTVTIIGNAGANALTGSALDNVIDGRGGDDDIAGQSGADELRGGSGNDIISGGSGDDTIFGGTGDDTITGGAGRDVMIGNQGADTFNFEDAGHMGLGVTRDKITGFARGADVIDLSAIDDTAFSFLGTGGFTGSGGMEVRYTLSGPGVIVQADADGDGVKDGEFMVTGVSALDAGDFLL